MATAVKERPILFSAPMVRAIIDGRKTQTRRVVKPQPSIDPYGGLRFGWATFYDTGEVHTWDRNGTGGQNWNASHYPNENKFAQALGRTPYTNPCPYGVPGNRLWVREALRWSRNPGQITHGIQHPDEPADLVYAADNEYVEVGTEEQWDALPVRGATISPIHMPRWASRILLEVVSVRVERLQSIDTAACLAEGMTPTWGGESSPGVKCPSEYEQYAALWDSIHSPKHIRRRRKAGKPTDKYDNAPSRTAAPSVWAANPFVWAVEFRRVEAAQ